MDFSNDEIFYKRWNGTTWSADVRLTNDSHTSTAARVASDPSGNVHVVWQDDRDAGSWEIYYKRWDGIAWSADERLTDAGNGHSFMPSIASDPSGSIHLVWADARHNSGNNNWEIYYKSWDGIAWSADERLTDASSVSWYPSIASDPSGSIHLVWEDRRDGNNEIYHKHNWSPAGVEDLPASPASVAVRCAPAPFSDRIAFRLDLPCPGAAQFNVYDASGRLVHAWGDVSVRAGRHELSWDGRDEAGRSVPSGVYCYWLVTPKEQVSGHVIRIR